jgi:hypothetical protein
MEIAGLPAHPLIIHAAVVLAPLAALVVIVFALRPGTRWLTRWPAAVGAVVAVLAVWAARLSGESMVAANPALGRLVATHQDRGELLSLVVIAFAGLTLLATWALGGPTALASGRGARTSRVAVLDKVLPVVLVLASLGLLASVVLTGDAGARAVWGG